MEISIEDYTSPVYKALYEPSVFLGIGTMPASIIGIFTFLLMYLINPWCIAIGLILLLICRRICKNDKAALSVLLERLMQPDIYKMD